MQRLSGLETLDSEIKMPVMRLPVRSTVARLSTGTVLISPGSKLTDDQLKGLGRVDDLVAPNGFHNAGMPQAQKIFPQARAWGVPNFDYPHILNREHWPHSQELPLVALQGLPRINEVVFIHKQSRTLICADLCFNLMQAKGLGAYLILNWLFDTYRHLAVSKFFLRFLKDKPAFERSLSVLFRHDFDNILMGHGEAVIGGGRERLLKAFSDRDLKPG